MFKLSDGCSSTCKDFPKEIPSYGDIGGIGVTLAFVLTAWMVVIVLVGYYLKVYDPRLDPFRKEGTQRVTKYPNSIDYSVHEILQSIPWLKLHSTSVSSRPSRLGTVLNACVLMFADVQIFTSLAILIGAYASVGCDIVAYHWQYMIYLAWLASVTHLASLSFLRNHLANNPAKRTWRLVSMCIIQVMLSVAVGLSMTFEGEPWLNSQGGRPAICYFENRIDTSSNASQSSIKFIILIAWGLAIRIAKTFESFEGGLRRIASRLAESGNRDRRTFLGSTEGQWSWRFDNTFLPLRFLLSYLDLAGIGTYWVVSIQLDLFTSLLAEVYWVFFTITWITTRLVKLRIPGNQDDSKWMFGQVLPIILLIAPLAIAIESFCMVPTSNELPNTSQDISANDPYGIRDLSHIHSSTYRGVFFLAVLSYIAIAVYFVLDQAETQSFASTLIRINSTVFVLQPTLQVSWVVCNMWLDKMALNMALKRTIRDVVLVVYSSISLVQNFDSSDDHGPLVPPSGSTTKDTTRYAELMMCLLILYAHASLAATFVLDEMLRGTKWRYFLHLNLLCVSYLILRAIMIAIPAYLSFASILPDKYILTCAGVSMFLLLFVFSLEVWAGKKNLPKRKAFFIRSVVLLFLCPFCLLLSQLLSYMMVSIFLGGFLFSLNLWSVIGLCVDGCRHSFDTALDDALLMEP
ncbi:uncharacterized protein FMAN_12362 [Fusarium mangiferae]|uniref:Uncharacterized protein n=1 Tax=Fusarium mangiferae TaxID=192010 RepID=A0A1L7TQC4_FUSMA|nr:uncharacterized protein FMAN_12362 [Fusarium mangiferae]CVK98373.1 uncharacterized protein FMAN_12362 [Fusarium mangiferae]